MRRTHLRGHDNILKRLLIHSGGFNLGLLMRQAFGVGTPRGLQGRLRALLALLTHLSRRLTALPRAFRLHQPPAHTPSPLGTAVQCRPSRAALTTGC